MKCKVSKRIQEETPEEVRIFVRKYADIVVSINEIHQQKGDTQKERAERMNKKPSEINKWLKGNHNLTLKTIAKLEAELGEPIIGVRRAIRYFFSISSNLGFKFKSVLALTLSKIHYACPYLY